MPSHLPSEVCPRELTEVVSLKMDAWHKEREPWSDTEMMSDFSENLKREYYATRLHQFSGLATDFDGTLSDISRRDDGPPITIMRELRKLLRKGCFLIIITGRGRSVKPFFTQFMRKSHKMYLCLYNGARIIQGGSELVLFENRLHSGEEINNSLLRDSALRPLCRRIANREYEIQIFPKENALASAFSRVHEIIRENDFSKVADVSSSGWTIDITPKGVDKGRALDVVATALGEDFEEQSFLKLGDQGHRDGNDFTLLKRGNSFSVGTVTGDATSCFPVVDPQGKRLLGTEGTKLVLTRTIFRLPKRTPS